MTANLAFKVYCSSYVFCQVLTLDIFTAGLEDVVMPCFMPLAFSMIICAAEAWYRIVDLGPDVDESL